MLTQPGPPVTIALPSPRFALRVPISWTLSLALATAICLIIYHQSCHYEMNDMAATGLALSLMSSAALACGIAVLEDAGAFSERHLSPLVAGFLAALVYLLWTVGRWQFLSICYLPVWAIVWFWTAVGIEMLAPVCSFAGGLLFWRDPARPVVSILGPQPLGVIGVVEH